MREYDIVMLCVPRIEITQISYSCVISVCHGYNQQLTLLIKIKQTFSNILI